MASIARKNPLQDELWNVSLLPTLARATVTAAPAGPAPGGGYSQRAPAVLSIQDRVSRQPEAEAA